MVICEFFSRNQSFFPEIIQGIGERCANKSLILGYAGSDYMMCSFNVNLSEIFTCLHFGDAYIMNEFFF